MKLCPSSITETYITFQDLHTVVNIYASKEGYAITIKRSKKSKKGELWKVWMHCNKGGVFKAKGFRKWETATRRDECLFMIIANWEDKIKSWSLVIADAIHNYPPSLPSAYSICQQFACIDKVKDLIISQIRIGASSKQVITAIQSDIDEENPLVKPKDVYNKCVT